MTKADIRKMSPIVQLSYGFQYDDRPIYLAPAKRNVFLFMCRCKDISRSRAIRLWSLYCFVRDGDSIGPDKQSCSMVRYHVPTFSKSSDSGIKRALEELTGLGLLYKTKTYRALPSAPSERCD